MAAQIVHASGESIKEKLTPNTNAVVLSVKDETELQSIQKRLSLEGVPHVPIVEIDLPYTGQMTAIGIVPLSDRSKVKKIFSSLPLLGREK